MQLSDKQHKGDKGTGFSSLFSAKFYKNNVVKHQKSNKMRYNEPVGKYEILTVHEDTAKVIDHANSYQEAANLASWYQAKFGPEWKVYFTEI